MAKLRSLTPRIGAMSARVGYIGRADLERARDRRRDREVATRALYKTARWQRLRLTVFARDLYTCAMCHAVDGDTARLVCDHVEAHRGDVGRFWSGPFQTLCKGCHDRDKQRQERQDGRQDGRARRG